MVHRILSYINITFAFFSTRRCYRSILLVRILQLYAQMLLRFLALCRQFTIYFRLEILTNNIACSLHCLSGTQCPDRVDSVRPFAAYFTGIKAALQDLLNLNLTPPDAINDTRCNFICVFFQMCPDVSHIDQSVNCNWHQKSDHPSQRCHHWFATQSPPLSGFELRSRKQTTRHLIV